MPRLTKIAALGFALLVSLAGAAMATVPNTLQYQGRLTDNTGAALNGSFNVTFTIYADSAGTTNLWTETHPMTIANGLFSVTLGTGVALPATVSNGTDRFIGIKVAPDAAEMLPRQRLSAVAFARRAASADLADDVANAGGIASIEHTATGSVAAGVTAVLDSVDITIPGPGYIQVQSTGIVFANNHVNGVFGYFYSRLSEARFDVGIGAGWGYSSIAAGLPAGGNYIGYLSNSRNYVKGAAGTYRFYMNFLSGGEPWLTYPFTLTALYFPAAYGPFTVPPAIAAPAAEMMRLQTTSPADGSK